MTAAAAMNGRRMSWRTIGWSGAAALIALPALAMQFSDEVRWTAGDFLTASLMLGSVGLAFELVVRASASRHYRAAAAVALLAGLLLVWANGAVGIIGSERNAANLMFAGVIAVALLGAIAVRFRAAGLAGVMTCAAIAQAAIGAVALARGLGVGDPSWPRDVIAATAFFTSAWLASGWLFRGAGRNEAGATI